MTTHPREELERDGNADTVEFEGAGTADKKDAD